MMLWRYWNKHLSQPFPTYWKLHLLVPLALYMFEGLMRSYDFGIAWLTKTRIFFGMFYPKKPTTILRYPGWNWNP